jgi:hypothetical protein
MIQGKRRTCMKVIVGVTLAAALALAAGACLARGAAPSSFAPRGPEPHSTLADKHGTKGVSHKAAHHKAAAPHKGAVSHSAKLN